MVNVTKINVQEFLDACFGYLETLIVQEYHHLRYMGYNSLYECNMNFYILYGPLMFVNASESSSFALQAPSTDGDCRQPHGIYETAGSRFQFKYFIQQRKHCFS